MVKIAELYPQWTAILVCGVTGTIIETDNYVGESIDVALQNVQGTQNMRGLKDWNLTASRLTLINSTGDHWVVMPEDYPQDHKQMLARLMAAGDTTLFPALPKMPVAKKTAKATTKALSEPTSGSAEPKVKKATKKDNTIDFGKKMVVTKLTKDGHGGVKETVQQIHADGTTSDAVTPPVKKPRKKAVAKTV